MPVYTIVGGVNGVGKSSLTGALRAVCGNLGVVGDPDRLIAQCGGDAYAGGQLAVQRLESALAAGADFTQETTLSGGYPKRLCRRARASGYSVRLFYVGKSAPHPEPCCARRARHLGRPCAGAVCASLCGCGKNFALLRRGGFLRQ